MTTPLPPSTDFTSAANQGAAKTFMTGVRTFLANLLGTAGHGFDGALLAAVRRVTFAGTADAITSTLSPAPSAYVTGMRITGLLPGANTVTGPTLNLNALGAKTVKKRSGTGAKVALVVGDYNAIVPFEMEYDGTNFILLNPLVSARADIASAATLNLADTSGTLRITGTTTVTAVTLASGQMRTAIAAAALPLTHSASLILDGAASYTCAAGDALHFIGEPSGVVRVKVSKADGTAVASASSSAPTGSVFDYVGSTAPTGYVLLSGLTIGDASSGGTGRANADTSALFTLLWNSMTDAEAAVSSGRGASAAADYAAHKTITLPDARGRTIAGKDNMGGTTANRLTSSGGIVGTTLGIAGGTETHTLVTGELASHSHTGNHFVGPNITASASGYGSIYATGVYEEGAIYFNAYNLGYTGSGTAHKNTQPTLVLNKIIKL